MNISRPTNSSSNPEEPKSSFEKTYITLAVILYSFVILVGVTGNTLLIATISRHRSLKTPCNFFIVSIAVADLCVALISAPLRITEVYQGWPLGDFLCHFLAPLQDVFVCVSVVTHTVIAMERYRGIVTPLQPKIELKRARQVIVVIWLGCYLLDGLPMAFTLQLMERPKGIMACRTNWASITSRRIFEVYLVIIFIVLPLTVQTMAYARIVFVLRVNNTAISRTGTVEQRAKRMKRKTHLVKMLVILVAIFQICYIPRGIQMLLWEFGNFKGNIHFQYADLVLFVIYYLKHVINPIILFAMSTDYRTHCKHDFCCCFSRCYRHDHVARTSSLWKSTRTEQTQIQAKDNVSKYEGEQKMNTVQSKEESGCDTRL